MSTLITGIGELVTNDPQPGRDGGPLGIVRDAAVLVEGGRLAWLGQASDLIDDAPVGDPGGAVDAVDAGPRLGSASSADEVVDLAGNVVIPGFVDSHTHLVFGGDRAAEFEARMAGRPYEAGGIRTTVEATRAASDEELRARTAALLAEARSQGTTTIEIKTGYGLDVEHEARLARLASEVTDEVTFLGAHVVPAGVDAEAYVDVVVGEMLAACAPYCRWVDVFCEDGAFTVDQSRRILEAGIAAGLLPRIHAGQLGPGGGVRMAVELGAASVDHATFLSDDDVAALAGSPTVATLLPGAEFSTRQPYPDARRLLDAGVTVALASDCNPGSSFTTSMPLMVALAVREMGMTPGEALWAATAGGARALRRSDVGRLGVGARADLVELAAPTYVHLAYRPGVPLVRRVWRAGELVATARGT